MRNLIAAISALVLTNALVPPAAGTPSRVVERTVHARALEGNLLGDSANQHVSIYLPPGYDERGTTRFPVVFFLHGFADNHRAWANGMKGALDQSIATGAMPPTIFVFPNGRNGYLSSYFTNSPVAGNWEDYVVGDLVADIDASYTTLAHPGSRGIAGHSKGGFAAIRLAMRHPDVFGSAYAMSPCCLSLLDTVAAAGPEVWQRAANLKSRAEFDALVVELNEGRDFSAGYTIGIVALAAAFSPNKHKPPMFVDLPFSVAAGKLKPEAAQRTWAAQSLIALAPSYKQNLLKLRALAIDYGHSDVFADIPPSIRRFSSVLSNLSVPHKVEGYDGGHENKLADRATNHMFPFFARTLSREPN